MLWKASLAWFSSPPSTALWKPFSSFLATSLGSRHIKSHAAGFSPLRSDCSWLNSVAMGRSLTHLGLSSSLLWLIFKFPFKIVKIYIDFFCPRSREREGGKRLIMGSEQMNEWIKCTWLSRNRTKWMKPKRTLLFEPLGHLLSYVSP